MGFRSARIAAGLTVAQVVKALGVSDASVYMWETGETRPKSSRLPEVAQLYHTTVDDLLSNNDSTTTQDQ